MSLKARLYKFLLDMGRITIEDVPEPYKSEILIEKYGAEIEATVKVVDTTL